MITILRRLWCKLFHKKHRDVSWYQHSSYTYCHVCDETRVALH